ncbi:hypothetical protein J4442_04935 [Candidatus Woesearchaeota archaeon]|nr:hypothetical protein [Candidatus Woesearchaeota archaeon]
MVEKINHQDISLDNVAVLTDMGINQRQALETLAVFSDLRIAMAVVGTYKHPPTKLGQTFGDYDHYLTQIIYAISGISPPSDELTLYEDEVAERTTMVSERELHQDRYRDRPWNSSHFYEHLASRLGE